MALIYKVRYFDFKAVRVIRCKIWRNESIVKISLRGMKYNLFLKLRRFFEIKKYKNSSCFNFIALNRKLIVDYAAGKQLKFFVKSTIFVYTKYYLTR